MMSAIQCIVAWLGTIRYRIFARRSRSVRHLLQRSFAAGAVGHDIGRSRAMRGLGILLMTGLLANVLLTVERPTTDVWTFERASPLLHGSGVIRCRVGLSARLFFCPVPTQDILLCLPTVASCRNTHLASSTRPIVTWSRAAVLPTCHDFSTYLAATPSVFVVGIHTASRD
jgi:hypothetical protein